MLSDILATIIAFISIILLLSVVVTSLVQVSQAIFRLRSRNLMKGLAALLVNSRTRGADPTTSPTAEERREAKKDAIKILNTSNVALMDRVDRPDSWLRYWLLGPKVSWMDAEELPAAVDEAKVKIGKENSKEEFEKGKEELKKEFAKSELHLKKRFLRMTRIWSIAWALVVAIAFQVSAPTLFNELSRDSDRRDRIVADAEQLLAHEAESLSKMNYDLVAPDALERLAERHEQHRDKIEEAIGVGTTRLFLLEELELALEEVPEREAIVADYDQLLDDVADAKFEETAEELKYSLDRLHGYDIELWPRGSEYYVSGRDPNWNAIVGVLITAILLSLGGSFWFEQLRNVLALRDSLARGTSGVQQQTGAAQGETGRSENEPSDKTDDLSSSDQDSEKPSDS